MDINSITLVGRVAADPEFLAQSGGNSARITFRLAVSRNISAAALKKNPNLQTVDYFPIAVFGPAADTHAKYIRKGKELGLRGQLQNNERTAADGTRTWFTSISASEVSYGADSSKNRADSDATTSAPTASAPTVAGVNAATLQAVFAALAANGALPAAAATAAAAGATEAKPKPVRLDGPPANRQAQVATDDLPVEDPFAG